MVNHGILLVILIKMLIEWFNRNELIQWKNSSFDFAL